MLGQMQPSPSAFNAVVDHVHQRFADADAALRAAGYRYDLAAEQWLHPTRAPAYIRRAVTLDHAGRQVTRYLIAHTAAERSARH